GIHSGEPLDTSLTADGSLDESKPIKAKQITGGLLEGKVGSLTLTVKKIPAHPVLFAKNLNALAGPGKIVLPKIVNDEQMDYECELTVVIGKKGTNIPKEKVRHTKAFHIHVPITDVPKFEYPGSRTRSWIHMWQGMDNFAPIGPQIVSSSVIQDPQTLRLRTVLNGETMQDSNTADMIFGVAELVSFLSQGTTLVPGTIIMTGTPSGVGVARNPKVWIRHGDRVQILIEKIGTLDNVVEYEKGAEYRL
ncbi:hypothetical protein HDU93_009408, partial [Gonapodya sp. JEL0774]